MDLLTGHEEPLRVHSSIPWKDSTACYPAVATVFSMFRTYFLQSRNKKKQTCADSTKLTKNIPGVFLLSFLFQLPHNYKVLSNVKDYFQFRLK